MQERHAYPSDLKKTVKCIEILLKSIEISALLLALLQQLVPCGYHNLTHQTLKYIFSNIEVTH